MPIELRYLYSFGGWGKVQTDHSVPALEDGAFAMLTRRIVQIPSFIALSLSPALAWAAGGTVRVAKPDHGSDDDEALVPSICGSGAYSFLF
jgi:hypothetical protein